MHIAFDAKRLFNNHTGLGNYSRTLVSNFKENYHEEKVTLFATETANSRYYSEFKSYEIVQPGLTPKALWRSYSISKDINELRPDIYHGLSNEIPFSASKIKATKIVTIHDLFFLKYPHDFSKIDRWLYKRKTVFSCDNADHIIAISEATKADLINYLNIKEEKISVVYQSCASLFQNNETSSTSDIYDLPSKYFLYVGTLNKRKNIQQLLRAIAKIPKKIRIPVVVVGGGTKSFMKSLMAQIESLGISNDVVFLGSVDNQSLKQIYHGAVCTVLTSFYEGFGIPIIESLFSQTPVIVSNVSALPEAAGDCGVQIDPSNVNELVHALELFIVDTQIKNQFQLNMDRHLKQFSAKATADRLHSTYQRFV